MIYNEKQIKNETYLFKDFTPINRPKPIILNFFEQLSYIYQRVLLFLDARTQGESDSFFKNGSTNIYSNNTAKPSELEHYITSSPIDLSLYTEEGKKYSLFTNDIDAMKVKMYGLCVGAVALLFQKLKEGVSQEEVFNKFKEGVPYEGAVYHTVYASYKPVVFPDLKNFLIKFIDAYQIAEDKELTYRAYLAKYIGEFDHPRILESVKVFFDTNTEIHEDFAARIEEIILSKKLQINYAYRGTFRSIFEHYSGKNLQSTDRLAFVFSLAGMQTTTLINDTSPDKVLKSLQALEPGNYGLLMPTYNFWGCRRAQGHFVSLMIDDKGIFSFYDPNFGIGQFDNASDPVKNAFSHYTGLAFSDECPEGSITFFGWLFNFFTLSSNPPLCKTISSGFSLIKVD